MKHILNALKNEIFKHDQSLNDLVKRVTIAQESYLNDRSNEAFFTIWSDRVKELQKTESNLRHLRSAYVTLCDACEIQPLSNDEIVAEKSVKKNRKSKSKNSTVLDTEQQTN